MVSDRNRPKDVHVHVQGRAGTDYIFGPLPSRCLCRVLHHTWLSRDYHDCPTSGMCPQPGPIPRTYLETERLGLIVGLTGDYAEGQVPADNAHQHHLRLPGMRDRATCYVLRREGKDQ